MKELSDKSSAKLEYKREEKNRATVYITADYKQWMNDHPYTSKFASEKIYNLKKTEFKIKKRTRRNIKMDTIRDVLKRFNVDLELSEEALNLSGNWKVDVTYTKYRKEINKNTGGIKHIFTAYNNGIFELIIDLTEERSIQFLYRPGENEFNMGSVYSADGSFMGCY